MSAGAMRALFGKALVAWAAVIPFAIANGLLRQKVLVPALGDVWGLAASGVILCAVIAVAAELAARWYGAAGHGHGFALGAFWLVLTLGFEVGMALGAQDRSWNDVARAFNPATGNLWLLVLATTLFAPILAARRRASGASAPP
ncbi:MAG TPA: hypothetical protein VFL14_06900 [Xanthomonadales bacterium]|nr:hypothetical protein [Xanthomonadales bacterium]